MATDYLIEIESWDRSLHLLPSPGGIPEEHTFQGEMIFERSIELEGRVLEPFADNGKRFRAWLSRLWPPDSPDHVITDIGSLEERDASAGPELLANLSAPENALPAAAICLGSSWKYLAMTTSGRRQGIATVTEFSFSRLNPAASPKSTRTPKR